MATLELVPQFRAHLEASAPEYKSALDAGLADLTGDFRLVRFLMARDDDFAKAGNLYAAHLRWRTEVGMDRIRAEVVDKPFVQSHFPHYRDMQKLGVGLVHSVVNAGESRTGEVVHLELLGLHIGHAEGGEGDRVGAADFDASKLFENYYAFFERRSILLEQLSVARSKLVRNFQIRDVSHIGPMALSGGKLGLAKKMIAAGLDNYPESASSAVFLNAPSFFAAIFSVVQTFLPAKSKDKIRFLGGPPQELNAELLKFVRPGALVRARSGAGDSRLTCAVGIQECLNRLQHFEDGAKLGEWVEQGEPRPAGKETFKLSVKHGHHDALVFAMKPGRTIKWQAVVTPAHAVPAYVLRTKSGAVNTSELQAAEFSLDRSDTDDVLLVIALLNTSSWWNDREFEVVVEWS
jgi:hypothetical protein